MIVWCTDCSDGDVMTSQSTAMMLAQMLQGKKAIAVAAHAPVDETVSAPLDASQSNSQASNIAPQMSLKPNQNMEQVLNSILGASFDKKNTPME